MFFQTGRGDERGRGRERGGHQPVRSAVRGRKHDLLADEHVSRHTQVPQSDQQGTYTSLLLFVN